MANDVLNIDDSMLAEALPTGLIALDNDHAQNMANFSMYVAAKNAVNGDPTKKDAIPPISQDELRAFGNWTGQTDTKLMAADLKKRNLQGAQQLIDDKVDTSSGDSIRKAQSDWKPNAIQEILGNIRKLNLRTPQAILANKNVLLTNKDWREAVNTDTFKNIHGNFWDVIANSIAPEQWAKLDSSNNIAKK